MDNLIQLDRGIAAKRRQAQEQAQEVARIGAEFVMAVRTEAIDCLKDLLLPGSPAAMQLEIFGANLFRIALRLEDSSELGQLAPVEFETQGNTGLLVLGVLEPLEQGEGHLKCLLGASLFLQQQSSGAWSILEVLPGTPGAPLDPNVLVERTVLDYYQGYASLPLQEGNLDPVERLFLKEMQGREGLFNLDELLNAFRLWRDFLTKSGSVLKRSLTSYAAAVEYLISLFDRFQVEGATVAKRYSTTVSAVQGRARLIAHALNATQFDDRYSIHTDPIAHYRQVFEDISGRFNQHEMEKAAQKYAGVFNTIEVSPNDTDFFGPTDR
ncbi:MAG: hypothetical protein HXX08_20620 [Chloroflexi bacterium]|uniref:Uncharacterized protein n=1 Tax=Candidatus Chlorohelix allophototropha TaxID=3003348 RepID=A0A8T7M800_9CHLR|nr:hypothetical protein [Chloroflexota bacterium]WJW68203.1 hypothetical protein OZ401_003807 [Chloroflexota bacterium L227-S17]